MKALALEHVSMSFGGLRVLEDVHFDVAPGEIVSLIGPNGAGKTTVFNLITGIYAPTKGAIHLDGRAIQGWEPSRVAARGVTRTFQNIRLFKDLSVMANAQIARHAAYRYTPLGAVFQTPAFRAAERENRETCAALLRLFGLESRAQELAKNLPYGQQRKLEIVRALATRPKVILLDEPAAGLNERETHDLMELIHRVRAEFEVTVLLIEHDMKLVMGISDRVVVLHHGVAIAEGEPAYIRSHPAVIEAYLGKPA